MVDQSSNQDHHILCFVHAGHDPVSFIDPSFYTTIDPHMPDSQFVHYIAMTSVFFNADVLLRYINLIVWLLHCVEGTSESGSVTTWVALQYGDKCLTPQVFLYRITMA